MSSTCSHIRRVIVFRSVSLFSGKAIPRFSSTTRLRIRGRVVDENLGIAFPEKSDTERKTITRRMWEHVLLMMCEAAQLQRKSHETNWRKYVEVRSEERRV